MSSMMTSVSSSARDWRLVLVSASLGAAIAGLSLYFCLIRPRLIVLIRKILRREECFVKIST